MCSWAKDLYDIVLCPEHLPNAKGVSRKELSLNVLPTASFSGYRVWLTVVVLLPFRASQYEAKDGLFGLRKAEDSVMLPFWQKIATNLAKSGT